MADRRTSIRASQLKNFSITGEDVKDNSLPGGKLIDNTVSGTKLVDTYVKESGHTMTGNLTIPSLNDGPLSGLRNFIINGDFRIAQRGTSFTSSSPNYTVDHVRVVGGAGTGNITVERKEFTLGQTDVDDDPIYYLEISSTGDRAPYLYFPIEDVRLLAGKKVTLSFWAKVGGTSYNLNPYIGQEFGSGGSSAVYTALSNITPTTSWAKYTRTFTIPSISGKTLGSGHFSVIHFSHVNTYNSKLYLANIQLELGNVVTPFEKRPIGLELLLCQRYYEHSHGLDTGFKTKDLYYIDGSITRARSNHLTSFIVHFKTVKRVAPTMTFYNNTGNSGYCSWENPGVGNSGSSNISIQDVRSTTGNAMFRSADSSIPDGAFIYANWEADAELR